ncbi:cell division cycle 48C [Perilla frutescens var. hirtella]|nr:cell division cycle 48C [Perilla frutescens var. hirtella]
MGKRRGGGAAKQPSNIQQMLRHHIEAAGKKYSTTEHLVDHLRSSYRHYTRLKLRLFTKHVERIIQVSSGRDDTVGDTAIMKKRRKIDHEEETLQLIEDRNGSNSNSGCSSSSLASASTLARDDLHDEETEEASYGETFEPAFDLIKTMMREDLCRRLKKIKGRGEVKEDLELETVDDKGVKEVNLMREKSRLGDGLRGNSKNGRSERDEIKGPMFKDFGGIDGVIKELKRKVLWPFHHPDLPRHLGTKPITGILFKGPPGCGKSTLARAIANETGVPLYEISATELVSGISGASEENIRELFSKANRTAPSIVFIDEIDAIASKRENTQRGMELRIVTQLMACMDESRKLVESFDKNVGSESSNCRPSYVLVIGATNRADSIDSALRRFGRFDHEIFLGVPNETSRVQILSRLTSNVRIDGAFDILKIARSTPGFVGADLEALICEAGNIAMNRILDKRETECSKRQEGDSGDSWEDCWKSQLTVEELENTIITMADIEEAVAEVQPSTKREGFSNIPNVKWDDIGGHHSLRKAFDRYVIKPIKCSGVYEKHRLHASTGFLLYGPPGCGKTLIAQAVANEAGANFIYIKGPEILNKYVGESELAVRTIFDRARTCSPCILFFDEVDALTTNRGAEGSSVVERILNQLLTELDGNELGRRKDVYVIGATNRPQAMDHVLLRPGRLGRLLYVPLPSPEERGMILHALARVKSIEVNADLMAIGKHNACKNFSGADLSSLIDEAVFIALEEQSSTQSSSTLLCLNNSHFSEALKTVSASVSDEQIEHYRLLSKSLKAG